MTKLKRETQMNHNLIMQYDLTFNTKEIAQKLPYLDFKPEWEVKVAPPFMGATIRFSVRLKTNPDKEISVYLDWFNNLGYAKKPYWEIFPDNDEDTQRFALEDVDTMLETIDEILKGKPKKESSLFLKNLINRLNNITNRLK